MYDYRKREEEINELIRNGEYENTKTIVNNDNTSADDTKSNIVMYYLTE